MPSITSLVAKLTRDYPTYLFKAGPTFSWSPIDCTITYKSDDADISDLLHEVSHAILGHLGYARDIELLQMERDAWYYAAITLGPTYDITISSSTIQTALDTYRDWLHARSTCPTCAATGLQSERHQYRCLACGQQWRVNDARACGLRRYKTKNTPN